MKKKSILAIILLLTVSCGQWRISTHKPKLMLTIQNGTKPGQVRIKTDDFALENLSSSVDIHNGKILVSDNELKRFQLLDSDGNPELIIGPEKSSEQKKYNYTNFSFGSIGVFHMDKSGQLYIQNRIVKQGKESELLPSYILVFNTKGKLDYTLGQTGSTETPFGHIESIETDDDGKLMVISRTFDSWNAYGFTGKKRDYHFNLSKNEFSETEEKEIYKGTIENVKPFFNGKSLLISVAYYQGLRLKFRKLYQFSIEEGKIIKTLMTMPDPRNVLFNLADDKHVYFWNIENGETKFMICSIDGGILSNIRLSDKEKKSYYSKIFSDRSGQIYSFQITRGGIKLFEWE